MLLVMSTQGIFDADNSQSDPSIRLTSKDANSQLIWQQTQERIEKFLPNLLRDLFPGLTTPIPEKTTPTHEVTTTTVAMAAPSPVESPVRSTSGSPLSTSPPGERV